MGQVLARKKQYEDRDYAYPSTNDIIDEKTRKIVATLLGQNSNATPSE